ncbi:SMI1/KNR4 family protein [Chitinophaga rhizophila]|uniref:SMI1/KNR4 family protein n=1 Tax=Chitinophaga rhizophila TaxID=2866212 RepID=A0ABS7GD08_9BACT|nr:SMI1/KNR4 family protein [Chitinophaga rhizophila]MBW8685040.1 SMI1/KNR4 family protein [Chitinophaga rhizophila]
MAKYLDFLQQYPKHLGDPQGVSEDDIKEIERQFNVKLPSAYMEFIAIFGKKRGRILRNYSCEVAYLAQNRKDALKALRDAGNSAFTITDQHFIFGQWQGFSSYFFDCAVPDDDPPVYVLDAGKADVFKTSFSQLIREELNKVLKFDGVIKK